jgi:hypothetical protein
MPFESTPNLAPIGKVLASRVNVIFLRIGRVNPATSIVDFTD